LEAINTKFFFLIHLLGLQITGVTQWLYLYLFHFVIRLLGPFRQIN